MLGRTERDSKLGFQRPPDDFKHLNRRRMGVKSPKKKAGKKADEKEERGKAHAANCWR